MPDLRPGNLTEALTDYTEFADSMAETIEQELDDLLALDELPPLPKSTTDQEVRARRRFLIAIARGVVRHLVQRNEAFVIVHGDDILHPDINSEQL